jgi:hypothetical protein
MVEADREFETKTVVGRQARPLVAVLDLDDLPDAQEALRRVLFLDAGRLEQIDERGGRSVEDGDLFRIDLHMGVVDAQPGQRRHQVFDGAQPGAILFEAGRHAGVAHGKRIGLDIHDRIQIDALEHDAGVRRSGTQDERHLAAGMEADAGGANQGLEGALFQHVRILQAKTACRGTPLRAADCHHFFIGQVFRPISG